MKRVGIIAKKDSPKALELVGELLPWLKKQGYESAVEYEVALAINVSGHPRSDIPALSDIIIVFGGDGTLLSATRLIEGRCIPILGVNLGGLGFMAEAPIEEMLSAVEKALAGRCSTEERVMLKACVHRDGEKIAQCSALNDVVINKSVPARIIHIDTAVDGQYLTTFNSDGLIVSTPTGSTAYSLSAGGPILYPTLRCLLLTPICPHAIANRPIVLPDSVTITAAIIADEDVFLTMDGQVSFSLHPRDVVEVSKSEHITRLLIPNERDYFRILRTKLKWGER